MLFAAFALTAGAGYVLLRPLAGLMVEGAAHAVADSRHHNLFL